MHLSLRYFQLVKWPRQGWKGSASFRIFSYLNVARLTSVPGSASVQKVSLNRTHLFRQNAGYFSATPVLNNKSCRRCYCLSQSFNNISDSTRESQSYLFSRALFPWHRLVSSVGVLPSRRFSCCTWLGSPRGPDNDLPPRGTGGGGSERPLQLMEFTERIWPNFFKSIKNFFMMVLIRGYFDQEFTAQGFLNGAEQAACRVSSLISRGKFEELDNLVSREAVREIERNYRQLDVKQRDMINVNPADIFLRFIYEIGIIMDDTTNRRFVEVTAVLQGCYGLGEMKEEGGALVEEMKKNQENLYVLNYRFIKEYTKDVDDDWTINKLNHFLPVELAKKYGPFDR